MKKNLIGCLMRKAAGHLALLLTVLLVAGSLAEPAAAALAQETEPAEQIEAQQEAAEQAETCVLMLDAGDEGWFDGSWTPDRKKAQTVEVAVLRGEACAGVLDLLPVPETDGNLRFAGWSLKKDARTPEDWLAMPEEEFAKSTTEGIFFADVDGTVTEDLSLYAVWVDLPSEEEAGSEENSEDTLREETAGLYVEDEAAGQDEEETVRQNEEAEAAGLDEEETVKQDEEAEAAGQDEAETVSEDEEAEAAGQDEEAEAEAAGQDEVETVSEDEEAEAAGKGEVAAGLNRDTESVGDEILDTEAAEEDVSAEAKQETEIQDDDDPAVYTIIYDANGGFFRRRKETRTETVEEGRSIKVYSYDEWDVSRENYAFRGWSTEKDGGVIIPRESRFPTDLEQELKKAAESDGEAGSDGETSTETGRSLTVYAVWTELVTITFDANGGHYGRHHETVFQEQFAKGEEIDLDDFEPHRYGSKGFLGWSLTPEGSPLPSGSYIVQDSVTLYALWEKELWDAEIKLAKDSVIYNGKAQTPAVTVVYDGKTLKKDTDFKVEYSNNKNAGKATVKITGKGEYTGTVKLHFQITKAAQKITVKSSAACLAVGKKTTLKVSGTKGSPKYTYKSSNKNVATVSSSGKVTAKKVGTVKITVTAAKTKNYTSVSASVKVKVVPAATKKLTAKNEKTGIRLIWKKVTGANGYYIYRDGKKIATIKKGATVSYLDKGATVKNKKYTYKVVAKASTGTSTVARTVKVRRKVPKTSGSGSSSSSSGSSGETGSGTSAGTSTGTGTGSSSGTSAGSSSGTSAGTSSDSSAPSSTPLVQTGLRYCFESKYVSRTLSSSEEGDLAVIEMNGISTSVISAATARGVKVYGYLNAGALEQERSYYNTYKNLCIAAYDGWEGEYWVDVTDTSWTSHLIDEAKKMKAAGATGIYLDNTDILYMVETGFAEENTKMIKAAPASEDVYKALRDVVKTIQNSVGITVMPNGGDVFVRRFVEECPGVLKEVNQESVLYDGNKAQPTSERRYYTDYLDWCKDKGLYIRGIEYINTEAGAQKCLEYYQEHGWQGLYVSRHKNLEGD